MFSAAPFSAFLFSCTEKFKNNRANCQKSDNKGASIVFSGYSLPHPCAKAIFSSCYYNTLSGRDCQYIFILCFCLPVFSSCYLLCARTPQSQILQSLTPFYFHIPAEEKIFFLPKMYRLYCARAGILYHHHEVVCYPFVYGISYNQLLSIIISELRLHLWLL